MYVECTFHEEAVLRVMVDSGSKVRSHLTALRDTSLGVKGTNFIADINGQ